MLMKWVPRDALGPDGNSEVEIRNKLPVRDLLRKLKPDPRKLAEPPGQCLAPLWTSSPAWLLSSKIY